MKAQDFLYEARQTLIDRADKRDSGSGERSMARAVGIFQAWTGIELSEADGWRFMLALKMARERQGGYHADDYVDLCGYASLLGEHLAADANPPNLRGYPERLVVPGPTVWAT